MNDAGILGECFIRPVMMVMMMNECVSEREKERK